MFVSLHSHNGIMRYDPSLGTNRPFTILPAPVAGLAFDAEGVLWATDSILGQAPGLIWRITPDGAVESWTQIDDAVFLNACTPHPNRRTLLVCESMTGRILTVNLCEPALQTALVVLAMTYVVMSRLARVANSWLRPSS